MRAPEARNSLAQHVAEGGVLGWSGRECRKARQRFVTASSTGERHEFFPKSRRSPRRPKGRHSNAQRFIAEKTAQKPQVHTNDISVLTNLYTMPSASSRSTRRDGIPKPTVSTVGSHEFFPKSRRSARRPKGRHRKAQRSLGEAAASMSPHMRVAAFSLSHCPVPHDLEHPNVFRVNKGM
jgi:hypothetical protein